MSIMTIKNLKPGDKAILSGYNDTDGRYRRKLLAMGLTRGIEVTLKKIAPLGDPVELEVRGFSLSLRKSEAEALELKSLQEK